MTDLSGVEASALRNEVLADLKQAVDLTTFAITASMAVVGYGLSQRNGLVVLLPLVMLGSARREVINRRANVLRIATYLQAFGGAEFRYEARLAHFRRRHQRSPIPGWSVNPLGTFRLLTHAGSLCLMVAATLVLIEASRRSADLALWSLENIGLLINAAGLLTSAIVWFLFARSESRRLKLIVEHRVMEAVLLEHWRFVAEDERTGQQ